MLYLFLLIVIAVLLLMLLNTQQKNKTYKDEMQLVQCVKCGIYIPLNEVKGRNRLFYCRDCAHK